MPFTKDKTNYGLSNPVVSHDGFTIDDAGKLGKCYKGTMIFNGANDLVGNTWTIAMWVKSTSWSTYNDILACKNIAASDHCSIYFSILNKATLNIGVNAGSSSFSYAYAFENNVWYHLAATYDGKTCILYINGNYVK